MKRMPPTSTKTHVYRRTQYKIELTSVGGLRMIPKCSGHRKFQDIVARKPVIRKYNEN